jgi:hypothetical protein
LIMKPRITATRIYTFAAPLCLVAPALVPWSIDRAVMLSVLLTGLPLSIMAALLATIHAQYRLRETLHKATALIWAVSAFLIASPLPAWVSSAQTADVIWSARTAVDACASLLFVWVAWRAWKFPSRPRFLLTMGLAAVALFLSALTYEGVRQAFVAPTADRHADLQSVAAGIAEFFINAVVTCVLLVPAVAGRLFVGPGEVEPLAG